MPQYYVTITCSVDVNADTEDKAEALAWQKFDVSVEKNSYDNFVVNVTEMD